MARKSRFKTEEERIENRRRLAREKSARYRERNADICKAKGRAYRKSKLAAKAIAEGRKPGIKGRARKLSDEE
jgi:hypothetical protein